MSSHFSIRNNEIDSKKDKQKCKNVTSWNVM